VEKVRKKLTWNILELAWRVYEHQETPKLGYSVNELRVETNIF
jgi:Na+-translocating ferredoxin:NAD+ oxidoreductase RnfG subunit